MSGRAAPSPRAAFVELDSRARGVLSRRHPLVAGFAASFVIAVSADARPQVAAAIERLTAELNDGAGEAVERLADDLVVVPELAGPLVAAARREADFRSRLLADVGSHTAAEVAERAGGTARVASRWRIEGRVFAVPVRGTARYLAFQFDDRGRPLPVVAEVLAVIGFWPAWQVATWFVTPHPQLDRERPADVLRTRPAAVAAAARQSARSALRGAPGRMADLGD